MAKQQGTTYKTMLGKDIEFDKLFMRNETTLAVGNVKVNARGDELGPGGKIVKKREDIMTEYNAHPDSVMHHTPTSKSSQIKEPEAVEQTEKSVQQPVQQYTQNNQHKNRQQPKIAIKDIAEQDSTEEAK